MTHTISTKTIDTLHDRIYEMQAISRLSERLVDEAIELASKLHHENTKQYHSVLAKNN